MVKHSNNEYEHLEDALASLDVDTNMFDQDEDEGDDAADVAAAAAAAAPKGTRTKAHNDTTASSTLEALPLVLEEGNSAFRRNEESSSAELWQTNNNHVAIYAVGFLFICVVILILLPRWMRILLLLSLLVFLIAARCTIPEPETFRAKQQVRQAKNQQQQQQQPPKKENKITGKIKKQFGKMKNFVATEVTNAVGGYDDNVQFLDVGIGMLAVARNNVTNGNNNGDSGGGGGGEYYAWMGFFGQWRVLGDNNMLMDPDTRARLHEWLWKRNYRSTRNDIGGGGDNIV